MTKCFCDRCGAECYKLEIIKIPDEKISETSFRAKGIEVCPECRKEAERLEDICTDVRFALFKDFLKGGAQG